MRKPIDGAVGCVGRAMIRADMSERREAIRLEEQRLEAIRLEEQRLEGCEFPNSLLLLSVEGPLRERRCLIMRIRKLVCLPGSGTVWVNFFILKFVRFYNFTKNRHLEF